MKKNKVDNGFERKEKPNGIKRKKKKLGEHQAAVYILIVAIIIICIPVGAIGVILISASGSTGRPVEGKRFKGDLDPEITKDMVSSMESKISTISNVEDVEISLSTGQLTIYVDCNDTLISSEIEKIAKETYEKVNSVASVSTYFTSTSSKRMYDLAISAYNFIDEEGDGFICWNVQKNGQMSEPGYNEVTKALDENLAKELRGEIVEEE